MLETLKNSFTFQYTGGQKEHKLPAVRVKMWKLRATNWQVTDVGIAAGETLGGTIGEIEIKKGKKFTIFSGYDDELDELSTMCEAASPYAAPNSTGLTSDPMPTTATDEDSWWTFYGPWTWKGCSMRIKQDSFVTEFAAASAGYVTYEIDYEVYNGPTKSLRVTRESSASSTEHTLYGTGLNAVRNAFFIAGTADYVSRFTVNEGGKNVIDDDKPQKYAADYDLETRGTVQATCTKYLVKNIKLTNPTRDFITKMSTAATLVGYFFGN